MRNSTQSTLLNKQNTLFPFLFFSTHSSVVCFFFITFFLFLLLLLPPANRHKWQQHERFLRSGFRFIYLFFRGLFSACVVNARCGVKIRLYFPDSGPFCSKHLPRKKLIQGGREHFCHFLHRWQPLRSRLHVPLHFSCFFNNLNNQAQLSTSQHGIHSPTLCSWLQKLTALVFFSLSAQPSYTYRMPGTRLPGLLSEGMVRKRRES